jgi:hypothetical protein
LHIQVDKIDKKSFHKLEELVEENLVKKFDKNGSTAEPNLKKR